MEVLLSNAILVAIDGSEVEDRIIEVAMEQAIAKKAELVLFRVLEVPVYLTNMIDYAKVVENVKRLIYEDLEQKKEYITKVNPNIETTICFEYGKSAERTIISFVEKNKEAIQLIIMGVTGESEELYKAGSTTAYVVNHAPCNVLVVK